MIKKYLYVGLILVVIAVVIFYSVSSYITSGTSTSVVNVTVPAHGVANVPILVNSSQVSILFVYSRHAHGYIFHEPHLPKRAL